MPVITERARAKINLSLAVLGRRSDGYHEIASLIAFADVADTVTLDTEGAPSVIVQGPFACAIDGPNLVEHALDLLRAEHPGLRLGRVALTKSVPVAAGLGGGSSDAAALLRAVRAANPDLATQVDWPGIAVRLGADVPVCLENRAAWIVGMGEVVKPLATPLPPLDAVLVNPLTPMPQGKTGLVFRRLGAQPFATRDAKPMHELRSFGDRDDLLAFMRTHGNDLTEAATAVMPETADVLAAVRALPAVEAAGLCGAGPTCFGVFPSAEAAQAAASALRSTRPQWWIEAARFS